MTLFLLVTLNSSGTGGGVPQVGPGFYLTHPISPNQQSITWKVYYYAGSQRVAMRVAQMPVTQPQPTPTPQPYPAPTPTQSAYQENIFNRFVTFLKDLFDAKTVSAAPLVNNTPMGEVYFLLSNHLGSTTMTLNLDGSVASEMRYSAWGETRYTFGTTPTKRQYTGQIEDSYIKLYWYGSRWYDPALGRFISPDSIVPDKGNPQGLDRYAYVANNPISRVDTGGHCWGIASFIRGLPTYRTTCNNLDMALTIIKSEEASADDRVLAGAYITGEFLAHGTAIVYGGLLACGLASGACYTALTAGPGVLEAACKYGNCVERIKQANEAINNAVNSGSSSNPTFTSNQVDAVQHYLSSSSALDDAFDPNISPYNIAR
jgi:RHS repeat-associated protein